MKMPLHTILRATAVILTVVFIYIFGGRVPYSVPWDTFVYTLAFAHYYMALLYSGRPIKQAVSAPQAQWKLVSLLVMGGALYWNRYSLVIYFGVHHALNETYLLDRVTTKAQDKTLRAFRAAGVVLNLAVYLFLLRHHKELEFIPRLALAVTVAVSYVVFFYYLWRVKPLMNRSELIDNCAAEIVSVVALAVSFWVEVQFLYIVAYHFVFWAIRPLPKLITAARGDMSRYLVLTALIFAGAYTLSPFGFLKYKMKDSLFYQAFILFSYAHITMSFAISDAHPGWINRFFRKIPAQNPIKPLYDNQLSPR